MRLESDGHTVTLLRTGFYAVIYSITPINGANTNAGVGVLLQNGAVPSAITGSVKPMLINYACVSGSFLYPFTEGEQIFLGVYSPETVLLPVSPLQACNASMAIFQIG